MYRTARTNIKQLFLGIKEATPDPLLKNLPVIVLSAEDSDVPATNKRRRLTKNGSIVNDNVYIISSSDDVVLPLNLMMNVQFVLVVTETQNCNPVQKYSLEVSHDEAFVDSHVAGYEAVPHSNDSIDNEADDEYDYSDNFIDDGPIVDEPTS
ncbi:hypothetical protein Tco_1212676 [Tanacetum coccineum]